MVIPAINFLFLTVSAVMLAAAAYRARDLWQRPRPPDVAALVLTLTMLGLSFALQTPVIRDAQNSIVTNLGQILGNGTTLIAAFTATAMVLFISEDSEISARSRLRPRLALLAAALTFMTVFFVLNPTTAGKFTSSDAPLGIIFYYLTYLFYLGAVLVDLMALIRRYARTVPDPYLRVGMRIVSIGCAFGLLYMVGRTVNIVVGHLYSDDSRGPLQGEAYGLLEFLVAAVLPSIAVLLLVVGITFRRWAPSAVRPAQWWLRRRSYRRSYRRLEPLWKAVHDVLPELAFEPRDIASRPRLRLYGRVVELHDAELIAGMYVDSVVRNEVEAAAVESGLRGSETGPVVDAVVLARGLHAVRSHDAALPDSAALPSQATLNEMDLAREVRRLEAVSAAFTNSPLVRRFAETSTTGA